MNESEIKFCCIFENVDGNNHPKWISSKGLTLEKAKEWAERQVKKDSRLSSINDVYQITQE